MKQLKRSLHLRSTLRPLLFLLSLGITQWVAGQQDTLFWFSAPEVATSEGDNPVYLRFLTIDAPATVTVSQPANGAFVPITVSIPANDVDSINLTPFLAAIESPAADVVANTGLKITSTAQISAFYELKAAGNKEVFSLKGEAGIGTNFYTPFQKYWDNGATTPTTFSSIDIVATADNTTVLITPRTAMTGHPANVTYSVALDEGETFSVRDDNPTAASSLSGSIVSADQPIAVTTFSGGLSESGCLSTMGDQITTAAFTGKDYIIHRGHTTNERFYILATQNGTSITITTNSGTTTSLINWSETYEFVLSDTIAYVQLSKPSYLWHASGNGCNLSGAQLPPLFCAGTYSSVFTRTSSDSLGVLLYTRSGFEDDFAINGNTTLVQASDFDDVPGTAGAFKAALIYFNTTEVPVNSYNEVTNSGDIFGLGVLHGQHNNGSAYAYLSEFTSFPFVDAGPDDTVCANVPFPINGTVGGGSVTGVWSGTGYGSFQNGTSALSNNYIPSPLDSIVTPVNLILTSTGPCPVRKDTLVLHVTPAPIVSANADQTVCANNANVQLDGNVTGGATTGVWTTTGSGTFDDANDFSAIYTPSPADTVAGMVELILTSTNFGSCASVSDTMMVTITGGPAVDAGADTLTACSNNPNTQLNGNVSGASSTGKWTTSGSGSFSPSNLALSTTYQPSANDIANGSVMLYLSSTNNGLCNVGKDSLILIFTSSPVVDAGINLIACSNEASITLDGSVSGPTTSGVWTGGNGTFAPNDNTLDAVYTPTAAEISNGSMLLTLTSTNNGTCNSESDVVQVSFVAAPFANFSYTDGCLEDSTSFEDFSLPGFGTIAQWDWNLGDNTTSSNQNVDHLYTNPGTYDVTLIVTTNVGCTDTTVNTVSVYDLPTADFNYNATCSGSQVVLNFSDNSSTSGDAITSWFYDFGGQGSAALQNPSQLFIGSGDFVITQIVETVNGCVDTTIQIVNIPDRPEAGFYYNTNNGLNIGAEFNFIDTSFNSVSWTYDFGDGGFSSDQDPSHVYFDNGTYVVTQYVQGVLGCVDSASLVININTVTTEINTLIPNAISPNGDGKNDIWKLGFIKLLYPDATVEIYNRWGQQLFYSEGYVTPWDGSYEGQPVPDGTYYYVINLNAPGEEAPYKGSLLVLKNGQ